MKYSFLKKTRLKYVTSWLFLVGFILGTLTLNVLMVTKASAQELQGEWIDKVTIMVGNDRYRDSNPFDENNEWLGANQSKMGKECFAKLTLILGYSVGSINIPTENSVGQCVYGDNKKGVVLSNANGDAPQATAYRMSERVIFMPVCWEVQNRNPLGLNYDLRTDCRFVRAPEDATYKRDNIFLRGGFWDIEGEVDKGEYVDTSDMKEKGMSCARISCTKEDLADIRLINNGEITQPNPKAEYKITGTTPDEEVNGTSSPTCESNNGTIIIGWILCAILNVLDNTVDASTNLVNNLLEFNTENLKSGPNAVQLRAAWGVFRVISSFALVAVVLVMVIGQALGGGN